MRVVLRFLSLDLWGRLPASWQRVLSKWYAQLYNKKFSRHLIGPYCKLNYKDPDYLTQFKPASGNSTYVSFQDFFIRTFREPPAIQSDAVWPCEGLLCEYGRVSDLDLVRVKGEQKHLRTIFGNTQKSIPNEYYFSNVFLHNCDYHRIHSPVSGTVTRIERIPGELIMLRPWIYKNDPSHPALRNERVNIDLETKEGIPWYLSIVGGPAVGSIQLAEGIAVGSLAIIGHELATFLLGSTCCIASPLPLSGTEPGSRVVVGAPI